MQASDGKQKCMSGVERERVCVMHMPWKNQCMSLFARYWHAYLFLLSNNNDNDNDNNNNNDDNNNNNNNNNNNIINNIINNKTSNMKTSTTEQLRMMHK